MPIALPSSYAGTPVIPYAPNAPGDRGHTWDWSGHLETKPSGASIATTTSQTTGNWMFELHYVGLTRAEVHSLEDFFDARQGRKDGFWCPTFQHDFHAVDGPHYGVSGNVVFRDWGFLDNGFLYTVPHVGAPDNVLHPFWQFAFYRGGSWFLTMATGGRFDPGVYDETGARLVGYNLNYGAGFGGSSSVVDPNTPSDRANLMASQLLWCRFADDAMTVEWDHPHLANTTLRVQHMRLETPLL